MLRKLSGTVCAVCTVLYGLSLAADYLGIYTLDPQIQGYLLVAALVALGIFLLKTVTHIIFSIIGFAAAAVVLIHIFMR